MISPYEIASQLQKILGDKIIIVPRPDHPVLLSSPDILVGGNGKLTAIFCISRSTKSSFLKAKLVSARLAFPVTARMIAIFEKNVTPSMKELVSNFDEIQMYNSSCENLAKYCDEDSASIVKGHEKKFFQIKWNHAVLFSTALQIAKIHRRNPLKLSPPSQAINSLSIERRGEGNDIEKFVLRNIAKTESIRRKTIEINGSLVSSLSEDRKKSSQLRSIWQQGMLAGFRLDNGIPYCDSNQYPNILLIEKWPHLQHDPDKPLRSAAFSGWIMAISSTVDDIEYLVDRSQNSFRKRLNERA